jgi:serine/threonine protein kinase
MNIFHSDIRPANIFFSAENKIAMAPFGLIPKDLSGYQKAL